MPDSVKQEWRSFGSISGEHIWQGDEHIADVIDDINNPKWSKAIRTIAESVVLMHNDSRYKAAPDLHNACMLAESALAAVLRGGTVHIDKIRGAYEQLQTVLSEVGEIKLG